MLKKDESLRRYINAKKHLKGEAWAWREVGAEGSGSKKHLIGDAWSWREVGAEGSGRTTSLASQEKEGGSLSVKSRQTLLKALEALEGRTCWVSEIFERSTRKHMC